LEQYNNHELKGAKHIIIRNLPAVTEPPGEFTYITMSCKANIHQAKVNNFQEYDTINLRILKLSQYQWAEAD
jgi:hypothetical protein